MKFYLITFPVLLLFQLVIQTQTGAQPTDWTVRGAGGGGAVYHPTISPHNPNEMYLTCDMSICFHTTDFGQNWAMIPPNTLRTNRNASVQFTSKSDSLYAFHKQASVSVNKPYLSADGGTTWAPLAHNPWGAFGTFQIFPHTGRSNTLVVSSFFDVWLDTGSGTNFTSIYNTSDTKGAHLAGVFFDGDSLYVCTNKGLKYSFDDGANWTDAGMPGIAAGEEFVSFRGAREGGTVRFIAVTLSAADVHPRVYGNTGVLKFQNVYRMDFPAENTWTNITASLPNPTAPNNDKLYNIAMKANEIDTFYVGGQASVSGVPLGSIFRTDNGGSSFTNVFLNSGYTSNQNIVPGWKASCTDPNYMHKWTGITSTEGFCVDPNNLKRLVRSDLTAVHTSTDYGQTWAQAYTLPSPAHTAGTLISNTDLYKTTGLETTVGYWMHFLSASTIMACFGDILLIRSTDGGDFWRFIYSGLFANKLNDVGHISEHTDGTLYAATGETPGTNGDYSDTRLLVTPGRLTSSTDGGVTWSIKTDFGHPVLWTALDTVGTNNGLYVAVADVPGGLGGVYHCPDIPNCSVIGDWTRLPEPPTTEGRASEIHVLADGTLVAVYGPRNIGTVYQPSSGVFRFDVGASGWTNVTGTGMNYATRALSIDPNDPSQDTWYASVGKQGGTKGLYRTTDRGANWTLVYSGIGVASTTFHPVLSNEMYICTENGGLVYVTQTNTSFSANVLASYPFDYPQRVFFNTYNPNEVWVQNFGNGLRVGYTSLVLPVELVDFRVTCEDGKAVLDWTTAQELNNAGFEIERSSDGRDWETIGFEPAKATPGPNSYRFYDEMPLPGLNYYRLRQMDTDGNFEYSPVRGLLFKGDSPVGRVFPNPVSDMLYVEMPASLDGQEIKLAIYAVDGKLAMKTSFWAEKMVEVDVSELMPGVYFVRPYPLTNGVQCFVKK